MLLDQNTIDRVVESIDMVVSSYADFLVSRSLNTDVKRFVTEALQLSSLVDLSPLELAYVTGMLVRELGPDQVMKWDANHIVAWVNNNEVFLNSIDRITLDQLKNDTLTFINGLKEEWKRKIQTEIIAANQAWRGVVLKGKYPDANQRDLVRKRALRQLIRDLKGFVQEFISQMDRLIHTELVQYLHHASVAGLPASTKVYKIPHEDACEHCHSLHLDKDGEPKVYSLAEVIGNTNVGDPKYEWDFCIGPTHPWCSCVLYQQD